MANNEIPLPKDEVNSNLFCCFPTQSWSGKRINGYQVVEKSFDEKGQIFILRLKNQELLVTLTKDLIKSHHDKKDYTYATLHLWICGPQ